MTDYAQAARSLAAFYAASFGGKASGRFRLSARQMRDLLGRKRVYPEDVTLLSRAAYEEGLVLIDMDTFFVVMSARTFVNYRRLNADMLRAAGQHDDQSHGR